MNEVKTGRSMGKTITLIKEATVAPSGRFMVEDILSVTTGKLCGKIEGVYLVLSFFSKRSTMTHEIPELQPAIREKILKQCPKLSDISADDLTPENQMEWIFEKRKQLGEWAIWLKAE